MDKYIKDFDKFLEYTGMITENHVIKALGFKADTDSGGICTSQLNKLKKFINDNPLFHIVTQCCEEDIVEYDNCVRIVNRQLYYLALGNKKPAYHTVKLK